MPTFIAQSTLPYPVRTVFDWHERPGAMHRLTPPWQPVRIRQEAASLAEGSRAIIELAVPEAIAPRWVARHTGYRPGEEFRDVQERGPFRSWDHRHHFAPSADGGTVQTDEISYQLPFDRLTQRLVDSHLRRMFTYRHRQLADDLAAHARANHAPLRVAISGASGLIGTALSAFLSTGGHQVIRLVRRKSAGSGEISWNPEHGTIEADKLRGVNAVIHLAGVSISGRWTPQRKKLIRRSRLNGTKLIAATLAELAADGGPTTLISGSAIGYYGHRRPGELLAEDSNPGNGFLAELAQEWEQATVQAEQAGIRVAHIRTGIVQSPQGGSLRIQLPLFSVGLGGRIGSGKQWLSWISLDDIIGIIHHILCTDTISGSVNGVAPHPVTNAEFASTLAKILHRPALIPVPLFGPQILFGHQATEELLLADQRVTPVVAEKTGYEFRHATLEAALRHLLGREDPAGIIR